MLAFAILGWVIAAAAVFAPTTLGLSPRVQGAALGDTLPGDTLHPYRGDSSSEEGDVGDVGRSDLHHYDPIHPCNAERTREEFDKAIEKALQIVALNMVEAEDPEEEVICLKKRAMVAYTR